MSPETNALLFNGNSAPTISNASITNKGDVHVLSFNITDNEGDSMFLDLEVIDSTGHPVAGATSDISQQWISSKKIEYSINITLPQSFQQEFSVRLLVRDKAVLDEASLLDLIQKDNVMKDVLALEGIRHFATDTAGLANARRIIAQKFSDSGYSTYAQHFGSGKIAGENIVGSKRGVSGNNKVIIVGAHYDTVRESPGADDNASGVAALLQLSQLFSILNTNVAIDFVAFDQEERGAVGSKVYVDLLSRDSLQKSLMAINMDMIGYSSTEEKSQIFPVELKQLFPEAYNKVEANKFRGDFVVTISNEPAKQQSERLGKIFNESSNNQKFVQLVVDGKGEKAHDLRVGDHARFWDAEIPCIYVGDGADTRNPHYHKSSDVSNTLDEEMLTNTVKILCSFLVRETQVFHGTELIINSKLSERNQ
ncbi:MAG: M28 family peptidase [Bacteroidota bacterium]